MKIYFVCSDIHGFYLELKDALKNAGFDEKDKNHFFILCGDAFDRGPQDIDVFNFLSYLANENRLIYIRGNHEDLLFDCVKCIEKKEIIPYYHLNNGTLDTISQFTDTNIYDYITGCYDINDALSKLHPLLDFIENNSVDYAEIDNYIFVHGWIPVNVDDIGKATKKDWENARWTNGMKAWSLGYKYDNKIIVCGHWHASYGNANLHFDGSEFGDSANYNTFIDSGIIALDACTAISHKINIFKFFSEN